MTAADSLLHATRSIYPGDAGTIVAANVAAQVAAVVVAAWATSRVAGRFAGAAARHGVWLCALACVAAVTVAIAAFPESGAALVRFPVRGADAAIDADSPLAVAGDAKPAPADATASAPPDAALASDGIAPAASFTRTASAVPVDHDGRRVSAALRAVCGAVFGVWLLGVALLTVRLMRGWLALLALRREAAAAGVGVAPELLEDVRRALRHSDGQSMPPVLLSDRGSSPITFGLLRPVVVLPAGLPGRLPEPQLRDVLVHEYAHVLRRDHLVGLAQRLVSIVLWPHPLVHLLNRELNRAREESCDDYVVGVHPRGPRGGAAEYARALVALAEMRGPGVSHPLVKVSRFNPLRPALPAAGILGAGWPLESRVAGLLDNRRNVMTRLTTRARLLLSVGFVLAATVTAGVRLLDAAPAREGRSARPEGAAAPATRPAAAAAVDERVAAQLDRAVPEVHFKGIAFADALDYLRDVSSLNVVSDWRALEEAGVDRNIPITYRSFNVKFRTAMKAVTTLAGTAESPVSYGAVGPVLFVSTPERVAAAVKGAATLDAKAKDGPSKDAMAKSLPELNFPGVALDDCLDFLRVVGGASIAVHWRELEAAGVEKNVPVHVRAKDVPFDVALHLVLFTSTGGKADYTIEDRQIMITSAAALAPERKPAAEKKPATAPARATGK